MSSKELWCFWLALFSYWWLLLMGGVFWVAVLKIFWKFEKWKVLNFIFVGLIHKLEIVVFIRVYLGHKVYFVELTTCFFTPYVHKWHVLTIISNCIILESDYFNKLNHRQSHCRSSLRKNGCVGVAVMLSPVEFVLIIS